MDDMVWVGLNYGYVATGAYATEQAAREDWCPGDVPGYTVTRVPAGHATLERAAYRRADTSDAALIRLLELRLRREEAGTGPAADLARDLRTIVAGKVS